MSNSQTTLINHNEIREWTEERGGFPAAVTDTREMNEETGIIRIAFNKDDNLENISWDEFFDKFDKNNLAVIVSANDNTDQLNKIVKRDNG